MTRRERRRKVRGYKKPVINWRYILTECMIGLAEGAIFGGLLGLALLGNFN